MDLILWRHAEAEDGIPDAARKLTPKGHKQAKLMARWLVDRLPRSYRVVVSPATRAQETAQALARKFETVDAVGLDATPGSILEAVGWPDAPQPVVVVGHQPTLGVTTALLLTGRGREFGVRKGSIVWIAFKHGEATLKAVVPPDLL